MAKKEGAGVCKGPSKEKKCGLFGCFSRNKADDDKKAPEAKPAYDITNGDKQLASYLGVPAVETANAAATTAKTETETVPVAGPAPATPAAVTPVVAESPAAVTPVVAESASTSSGC